jgi:hypothetical protein
VAASPASRPNGGGGDGMASGGGDGMASRKPLEMPFGCIGDGMASGGGDGVAFGRGIMLGDPHLGISKSDLKATDRCPPAR